MTEKFGKVSQQFDSLVSSLPDVLFKARANNTMKSYWGYFEKWRLWCGQFEEISSIPAEETYVILYILAQMENFFKR